MQAPIRDLGYMAWTNDLAHLETQTELDHIVTEENKKFKAALHPVRSHVQRFKHMLQWKPRSKAPPFTLKGWEIHKVSFRPEETWQLKNSSFHCTVWDADLGSGSGQDYFAGAVQDSDGFERFHVDVYDMSRKKLATLQKTGPQVGWFDGNLYYLGSSADLRYDSICRWNPLSRLSATLYTVQDPTKNLELGRAEDGSVHILETDFRTKRLGFIPTEGNEINWSHEASEVYVITREAQVIDGSYPGFPKDTIIESISLKGGYAITRDYGIRTLWQLTNSAPKHLITVWGEISFDVRDPTYLSISDIRYEPYVVNTKTWHLSSPESYPYIFTRYTDVAPTFVVYPTQAKPKALLITAYGAYGSPTRVGSLVPRWRPLLESGWCIASVCVPGSGDHDDAWKKAGQRQNRGHSIQVLTETIERLQEELGLDYKTTAFYGRSAGGLLCIATALANPGLVGALYVESPYVDVLRTISNPELPLTLLETKEFGIGSNPTNILATGAWSPMERIPSDKGIPELFVIARSDMADLEVLPYEVVKWIRRMRGKSRGGYDKLLYTDSGKGHFTTTVQSIAEDLALLQNWLDPYSPGNNHPSRKSAPRIKNHMYKYKMPGLSRKNRSRKDRKDRKDRKNRNAVTMGGRRKRVAHKGRKHTRRH